MMGSHVSVEVSCLNVAEFTRHQRVPVPQLSEGQLAKGSYDGHERVKCGYKKHKTYMQRCFPGFSCEEVNVLINHKWIYATVSCKG